MAKKNKKYILSTPSVIAIVVGVVVVVFMLLAFINHQIELNGSQESQSTLTCNEGLVLGGDKLCHPKCEEKGYCEDKDICYSEQCYVYPHDTVACMDSLEKDRADFNSGVAILNELPYETCKEASFKYTQASSLFSKFQNASEYCLGEVRNEDFLLNEIGYNMTTYLESWDNLNIEMGSLLLKQKMGLEKDCN